jgi:hypothetical protein
VQEDCETRARRLYDWNPRADAGAGARQRFGLPAGERVELRPGEACPVGAVDQRRRYDEIKVLVIALGVTT